jgi:hypothetical protein
MEPLEKRILRSSWDKYNKISTALQSFFEEISIALQNSLKESDR